MFDVVEFTQIRILRRVVTHCDAVIYFVRHLKMFHYPKPRFLLGTEGPTDWPTNWSINGRTDGRTDGYTFFFYKHKVHKHAQPQIGRILSTLLSTAPASDLVVDIKIYQNLQFFSNFFPEPQNTVLKWFFLWVICTDWVNTIKKNWSITLYTNDLELIKHVEAQNWLSAKHAQA